LWRSLGCDTFSAQLKPTSLKTNLWLIVLPNTNFMLMAVIGLLATHQKTSLNWAKSEELT